MRKNKNRGYQNLRVWQDAIEFYKQVFIIFKKLTFPQRKISEQTVASSDSIHRNIAEGYCRRSIREYLQFLNVALGSLGESVSAIHAYRETKQITEEEFEMLDKCAFKLENGLLKLVQTLEQKRDKGEWVDNLQVREDMAIYECDEIH